MHESEKRTPAEEKGEENKKAEENVLREEIEKLISSHPSHDKDIRPWGGFITLWEDKTFKVKVLFVLPGKRLSLQRHKWRREKWVIAEGEAFITKGNQSFFMREGNTVMIDKGELHRIENKSDGILKIVEVWLGEKLQEDDIERIEDDFGRT